MRGHCRSRSIVLDREDAIQTLVSDKLCSSKTERERIKALTLRCRHDGTEQLACRR